MNQILFSLLMGAPAAPAGAQAAGQQPSMLPTLLMFAAIILAQLPGKAEKA